jgi:hypothetical protein
MLMHLWDCITMQGSGFTLTLRHSLAISHNRVSSFPECISECKRLRYLNARYNALKEFPLSVRICSDFCKLKLDLLGSSRSCSYPH